MPPRPHMQNATSHADAFWGTVWSIRHYNEDELELLPPEKAAEDEDGHRDQKYARKAATVRRKFWSVMKKAARQIPIIEEVVAGYYCAFDSKTPFRVA